MKRFSVVWKLSIFTFIVFFVFYSFLIIGQAMFFEKFYLYNKTHVLEKNLEKVKGKVKTSSQDEDMMGKVAAEFMEDNDATLKVISQAFGFYPLRPYRIIVETNSGLKNIYLSKEGMQLDQLPRDIKVGDHIIVDGFYLDDGVKDMDPVQIQLKKQPNIKDLPTGLSRLRGKVVSLMLPKNRSYNAYYQDELGPTILMDLINQPKHMQKMNKGEKLQIEWQDVESGINYAVILLPFSTSKKMPRYLMAYTSLQPVDEAIDTMKHFYGYIAGAGVIVLILLSYIYSKMIARPLVSLNHVARQLAILDFSAKMPKKKKDEIGELSSNLEKMSSHLQNTLEQLRVANAELKRDINEKKRMEQLRKEFTANVSHELKTPLGIIRGFTEGLQDGIAENKRDRYLRLILNEVERMDGMVFDLLQLSKYDTNLVVLEKKKFSLEQLLTEVLEQFGQKLEEKKLTIDYHPVESSMIWADKKKIIQVLINILSNSIRHAYPGSAISIIFIEHSDTLEVQIANKGQSIPENQLERVWEQFYRIDSSRDRKLGGTGLGLAIVSQILQLHHSQYGVLNQEDGVVFYFHIEKG